MNAHAYDALYASGLTGSRITRWCQQQVFGTEDAGDLHAWSWASRGEFDSLRNALALAPGETLADFGCGQGGPGLLIAAQSQAKLIGLDQSAVAISNAQQWYLVTTKAVQAQFVQKDILQSGLQAASLDGAMSIDVVQLLSDHHLFFREVARCLKAQKVFAFATYTVPGMPGTQNYRPALEKAGFKVEHYAPTAGWRDRYRLLFNYILANKHTLRNEVGQIADVLITEANFLLSMIDNPQLERLVIVARKR
ncbi:MAG: class I SAM-dependent methyltransferase [Candidatus Obscuribacterales bacterium]|nr:class I SAM-dependent methyltransferase [Candidatus Obscuribacterales bacterium]